MKECRYCGTKYDDNLDICPNCGGNKVITEEERTEEAVLRQKEVENQERAAAAPAKKKNALIGVIVAVVVVIAAIAGFFIYKANQPLSNGMTKDEAQGVFDSGVAFMEAGQYEDAIDTFLQLPSDSKKYAEAQELILQSQDSYRADIVSRVDGQIADGDFTSAFGLVEKAQVVLPGDTELQDAYDSICMAYRTDILSRVNSEIANGKYESAFSLVEEGQGVLPGDAGLQGAYDDICVAYRTDILGRVDSLVANGNYESAFSLIGEAQGILPGDTELQDAYGNTYSAYRTAVLAKTDEYSQRGQYKMALEYLDGIRTIFSDDAQIRDAYDNINLAYKGQVRTTAIADADKYVEGADYVSAINVLNSAINKIGRDEEVAAKLNIISNDYAATVIDAAKAQYIEYDADSIFATEDMLEQALKVLPGNEALSSELAFYEDHEPIDIFSSSLLLREWGMAKKDSATDNEGNVHDNVLYVGYWDANAYGIDENHDAWLTCDNRINTDYQYSRITGVLFQNEQYSVAATRTRFILKTEENRETLWEGEVSGDTSPKYFSVDVTGQREVRVYLQADYDKTDWDADYEYAFLADFYLWK